MEKERILVEVCAESVESAVTAQQGGAFRIEFCDNMAEGGTTPSYGQIITARANVDIKLYPIIRPRGGDFVYTEREFEVMKQDVRMCGEAGCDGVVIGILDLDGNVDLRRNGKLVEIAHKYGMGVTFHRAFDVSRDLERSLEEVISVGCQRILTSGGRETALEGTGIIKRLIEKAAGRIAIMPGSGISPANAGRIIGETGCREFHGTFRSRYGSDALHKPEWAEYGVWHADIEKIRAVVKIAETFN